MIHVMDCSHNTSTNPFSLRAADSKFYGATADEDIDPSGEEMTVSDDD